MEKFKDKYASYALVTGASAGIGAELARSIAARGLNLVLVARRKEKLEDFANELNERYKVIVRTITADLGTDDGLTSVITSTRDLSIGLLVLNAAIVIPGRFLGNEVEKELDLINLNVRVPMLLTHHFGNLMLPRKKGGILLLSSVAGHSAAPYQANYAASKAYIFSFGQALNYELKPKGINVTVLSPGLTKTEGIENAIGVDFSKMPTPMMDAKIVAEAGINGLGKHTLVIPGGMNSFTDKILKVFVPRSTQVKMFGSLIAKITDKSLID